jgi:hypothetical protein
MAPVQRRDDSVQAAVPTGDHDRAAPGAVEHAVELAGVGGDGDLDVSVLPEHAEGDVQPLLSPTSGVDIGDEQEGVHDRHPKGFRLEVGITSGWIVCGCSRRHTRTMGRGLMAAPP